MNWNRLAHRLAVAICGPPPPRVPPGVRRAEAAADRMPAFIPETNPLEAEAPAGLRTQDAMTMMDPDCYGYLLLTVHKEAVGLRAEIRLAEQLDPSWWPAVTRTLERVIEAERAGA